MILRWFRHRRLARLPQRTAHEFFAGGAGGAALGLHWAGVPVTVAVEADPERRLAHAQRWGIPVLGDICKLTPMHVRVCNPARPWLCWFSPPCKGISEVNQKGKGVDDDGLFFEAIRLGVGSGADWLVFENVDRLRTRGLDRVLQRLELDGYSCWTFGLGSDVAGKDHERRRLFIVARKVARKTAPDTSRGKGRPARLAWAPSQRPSAGWRELRRFENRRCSLGHLRAEALGRHVRAYDGVSDRVADYARRAYGDSVDPIFPFVIARALIDWEEQGVSPKDLAA